jgi:hypothetical protein
MSGMRFKAGMQVLSSRSEERIRPEVKDLSHPDGVRLVPARSHADDFVKTIVYLSVIRTLKYFLLPRELFSPMFCTFKPAEKAPKVQAC